MDEKSTADERKKQFTTLFARFGKEVDWKLLPQNYAEMPDYEWMGFIQSIGMILMRRNAAEKNRKN